MIPGYIYDEEVILLQQEAAKVPENGVIVEVGSFKGKSTYALAEASKQSVVIYAVDTWDNRAMGTSEKPGDVFPEFLENVREFDGRIVPLRGESQEIGNTWNKRINLLFIDADHSEPAVYADLVTWVPFVSVGGILLMHDYTENCGVRPAFERYVKEKGWDKIQPIVIKSILKVIL
jgi:predicted O-methyltransferase YrrM